MPADGLGPSIVGSTSTADFPLPSGYDTVTLIGTPQVIVSRRGETGHAADSIDEALRLAATNRFSDIYFNRSFSTATNRLVQSRIRPDVIAVAREPFSVPFRYHSYESLSKGQDIIERQKDMPPFPFIARVYGNEYWKK